MHDDATPGRGRRFGQALSVALASGWLAGAASAALWTLVEPRLSRWIAGLAATSGLACAAWAAALGLVSSARARLAAWWVAPVLVLLAGALFVRLALWSQPDHGGLATAAVALVTGAAALSAAAVALAHTLSRAAPPAVQIRRFAAAGAAVALAAAARIAAAPSPEDVGWVTLPAELRDARTAARGAGAPAGVPRAHPPPHAAPSPTPACDPERSGDCDLADPPLLAAARAGDLARVRGFVDGGADLNVRDRDGRPPVELAAHGGHRDVVDLLLDAGAWDATYAAKGALGGDHLALARAIAARGIGVEHHVEGCTVLSLAAEKGDVALLRAVLAGNARVREACLREALEAAGRVHDADAPEVRFLSRLR